MSVRSMYLDKMSPEQAALTKADLQEEDRYDLSVEVSLFRQSIALLIEMEAKIRAKHPGREDLLLSVKAQQTAAIMDFSKMLKFARDIENAGDVYTKDKIANLLDKVASLVVYHVTAEVERARVLDDLNDLARIFRQADERGTLITPDQDARMMDGTIPDHEDDDTHHLSFDPEPSDN